MTFIEFFDKNATENVCSCLSCVPDRVIFMGNNSKDMKKHVPHYQRIFEERGHHIEFDYKSTPRNDLETAVRKMEALLKEYDDCVFDITGGDEMLLLALGVLCARNPEKNIQIHWFNLTNNTICDCDKDGNTIYREAPSLTAEEHIRIYGGDIHYGDVESTRTYRWEMDEEFLEDIDRIWNICKPDVRMWNIQAGIFAAVEQVGTVSQDGLTTTVSVRAMHIHMAGGKIYYRHVKEIVDALLQAGLLTQFAEEGDTFTVTYKNKQVKRCLTKAGQALEMKVYAAAMRARDKDGKPVYNDALNGVLLDWDGDLREQGARDRYDTENEMDILLMHGVVPVFISCKNGLVTTEELYKLNTIAERFGGVYSKKALVATALELQGTSGMHLRQRAKDMNIQLIENMQDMEDGELSHLLGQLWTKN